MKKLPDELEFCPVTLAKSLMGGKWKFSILWMLSAKTCRFNELERRLKGITQKTLTLQLRAMERDLLVHRKAYAVVPPRVEYSLTEQGQRLLPVMSALCEWTVQYWDFRKRPPAGLPWRSPVRPSK